MTRFNKTEIEAVNKFIQNFINATLKVLAHNLDKDIYKKIDFSINSYAEVSTLDSFKENSIIYKLDYTKGEYFSRLGIAVQEKFISEISDVLMGGEGNVEFEGTLSELEVNATKDLLNKIFNEIENTFRRFYSNDFGFSTEPLFLTKEMSQFENEFNSPDFDFLINLVFKINDEREYPLALLLRAGDLKKILTTLDIFRAETPEKRNLSSNISINQLADVEIDITAELGSTRIPVKYALELVRGSLVKLDTLENSEIKVFANNIEVARAQVVVVGDNFGLRITKIISPEERAKVV